MQLISVESWSSTKTFAEDEAAMLAERLGTANPRANGTAGMSGKGQWEGGFEARWQDAASTERLYKV